jgi:hypothetical protein
MNAFFEMLRFIIIDSAIAFAKWPIWWYSKGLMLVGSWALHSIKMYAKSISLGVWVKNLFVPMFGMRDWQSRIISFFMRLFQIIARSVGVLCWIIIVIAILLIYLFLPIISTAGLIYHGIGGIL